MAVAPAVRFPVYGFVRLLGRPLPRRHGALLLRGGQAPHLQRSPCADAGWFGSLEW
uniref:Uncharacterized protein n=1 Tax=Arundo donax TaxID=35708 RepID=A0A0A9EAP8_ARUDO